jgi:peptidylprolyl isomerase
MKAIKIFGRTWYEQLLKTSLVGMLLLSLSLALSGAGWNPDPPSVLMAALAQGNAITDPNAILTYALPIDNKTVRDLQGAIEDIANHLRGKRWVPVSRDVKQASSILTLRSEQLLQGVPDERKPQAEELIQAIASGVNQLQEAVEAQAREQVWSQRRELLDQITALEELMVQGFPFEVPPQYANLPQLKGRATVDIKTTQGDLTIVVDGYSAPVNAGNFVDLVERSFYNGLPFIGAEDSFFLQSGDPAGAEEGFIDPKTKQYRAIPLEILVRGEEKPIYGITLEEAGIYLPELALPFNAYGAVALAHPEGDSNGGSSQFFFFKFDNELTPPGFNLMDGRYSVFGYVVQGKDVLEKLTDKDKIISAKVVDGLDNLLQPKDFLRNSL